MNGVRLDSASGTMEMTFTVEEELERVYNWFDACYIQVQTVLLRFSLPAIRSGDSWVCDTVRVYGMKFDEGGRRLSGGTVMWEVATERFRPEWLRALILSSCPAPIVG
jgi:hypothetical protein